MIFCQHCGEEIHNPDGLWSHVNSNSTLCHTLTTVATPPDIDQEALP